MKKKFGVTMLMVTAMALMSLSGCSSKEEEQAKAVAHEAAHPKAGLQVVDTQMTKAKGNAAYLASIWQQSSTEYSDWGVEAATDSTISTDCPQGDGWATLYLIAPKAYSGNGPRRIGLKCSTWSKGKGCLLQSEFNTKAYKPDDGQCQPVGTKVVYPLESLVSTS